MFASIVYNLLLTVVFGWLNTWAAATGLEETFVTLAIMYGVFGIGGNAMITTWLMRKRK